MTSTVDDVMQLRWWGSDCLPNGCFERYAVRIEYVGYGGDAAPPP